MDVLFIQDHFFVAGLYTDPIRLFVNKLPKIKIFIKLNYFK